MGTKCCRAMRKCFGCVWRCCAVQISCDCILPKASLMMPSIPGFAALRAPHPSSPARRGGVKQIEAQRKALSFNLFAEREGFEPPDPLRSTVFKTAAFDHSAISPKSNVISLHVTFSVKWTAKISTFFEIASGWEEKA